MNNCSSASWSAYTKLDGGEQLRQSWLHMRHYILRRQAVPCVAHCDGSYATIDVKNVDPKNKKR